MENESDKVDEVFKRPGVSIDLPDIIKKGKLTVLAENSSTSYFIYKGKKMGFEYELLNLFAEEIGVELDVKIVKNLDSLIPMLNRGEGDIIACNYTITKERGKIINFSEPFIQTQQVLIQRKPEGWEDMKEKEWKAEMLSDPSQLAQKEIHVWKNSSYYQRLTHLQEEIGDTIFIEGRQGNIGGEELIELVSTGIIDYTITENNVAKVNEQFFKNLYTDLDLSVKQKMAFGLRKSSHLLKAKLDDWLVEFKKKSTYKYIHRKYYEMRHVASNSKRDHSSLDGTNISPYDHLFKKAAEMSGWDWRLIASVAYQESKFNPEARSFGGAYGMMQFMPNTGPHYGVYPDSPPSVQIMGGAKKLMADEKFWKDVVDPYQRKKFALASYNAGRGHIQDAQRLAKKYGLNHLKWDDNVEKMLLNLSKQKYYQDEVVRNGMMRSTTTYKYIHHVTERYMEWCTIYE
jgi:membrane-bound lytic murein transglycosylase F